LIKVLIVDDLDLIRVGIKSLLEQASGIKVLGEAQCGEEAVSMARKMNPDIILMDLQMPGIGGLEATKKLMHYVPDTKVIVLTICEEEPFPTRLIQAGAMGYLTKGCNRDEMLQAIRSVNSGQRYISPKIAQKIALQNLTQGQKSPLEVLSERELQVMLMITNGQKAAEIAEILCISPKTVNSYRYRIFAKLDISSDVDLTRLALRLGLFEDSAKIPPNDSTD
jgi:two-component system, NarL family, invasion response regulator UvrY